MRKSSYVRGVTFKQVIYPFLPQKQKTCFLILCGVDEVNLLNFYVSFQAREGSAKEKIYSCVCSRGTVELVRCKRVVIRQARCSV